MPSRTNREGIFLSFDASNSLLLEEKVPRRGGCGVAPLGAFPLYEFADRYRDTQRSTAPPHQSA